MHQIKRNLLQNLHLIFSIWWLLFVTCYLWLAICDLLSVTCNLLLDIRIFFSESCYYLQKLVTFSRCCIFFYSNLFILKTCWPNLFLSLYIFSEYIFSPNHWYFRIQIYFSTNICDFILFLLTQIFMGPKFSGP